MRYIEVKLRWYTTISKDLSNLLTGQFAFRRKGKILIIKLHDKKVVHRDHHHHAQWYNWPNWQTDARLTSLFTASWQTTNIIDSWEELTRTTLWLAPTLLSGSLYNGIRKLHSTFWRKPCRINAYVTYELHSANPTTHFLFIREAAHCLLVKGNIELASADASADHLLGKHFLEEIPASEKNQKPTQRCQVCTV